MNLHNIAPHENPLVQFARQHWPTFPEWRQHPDNPLLAQYRANSLSAWSDYSFANMAHDNSESIREWRRLGRNYRRA